MDTKQQADQAFDAVVIGGGPSGATAAERLARAGHSVALLDRGGRIKPCGGAIPPRLIQDFQIPDHLLVAKARAAKIISPSDREVDMPVEGGFVGMVDREDFDEYLRDRAARAGATRITGRYTELTRDVFGTPTVHYETADGAAGSVTARLIVGADGARSAVAKAEVPKGDQVKCVFAYHEIIAAPDQGTGAGASGYDPEQCEVHYNGQVSPDFYGWVFPHGKTASVGTGSAEKGFGLRPATEDLRRRAGLEGCETIRREGAPIPMQPLKRWDNGRDVVLAGDAAGVVAPASGEGIYYAMLGGELAAEAGHAYLATGDAKALGLARKRFMKEHGRVFWILGMMQWFWYCNDKRRERFVSMCADPDVQKLTWDAYMNKRLVRRKPAAHVKIFFKDLAHLVGMVSPDHKAPPAKPS